MIVPPLCIACKHLRNGPPPKGEAFWCSAFPGGIPWPIINNRVDHRKPIAGDMGIVYDRGEVVAAAETEASAVAAIADGGAPIGVRS